MFDAKRSINDNKEKDSSKQARDLLSLLVRANMATDLTGSQRLSDEDVLSRRTNYIPHR